MHRWFYQPNADEEKPASGIQYIPAAFGNQYRHGIPVFARTKPYGNNKDEANNVDEAPPDEPLVNRICHDFRVVLVKISAKIARRCRILDVKLSQDYVNNR